MLRVGCVSVSAKYIYDEVGGGREISAEFANEISRGIDGDTWEDFRLKIICQYVDWCFYSEEFGLVCFERFRDFLHFLHVKKISYVFAFDSVNFACALDYGLLELSRGGREFKRINPAEQRDEGGRHYKRVDCDAFNELAGELGQRYMYQIWTKDKGTRADGEKVMRRMSVHGCDFYFFDNIIKKSFCEILQAFHIDQEGKSESELLYSILLRFSDECLEMTGERFIDPGKKRPLAITCGGLAKNELLKYISSGETPAAKKKWYKKEHPLTDIQADFLRRCKLLRGGLNYLAASFTGESCSGLYKYDANSEYSYCSCMLPDLIGKIKHVDPEEFFSPRKEFEYILVVREMHMTLRDGMPPIFFDPFAAADSVGDGVNVHISNDFALFRMEYDELSKYYEFEYICPYICLRVQKGNNIGYSRFSNKYYHYKTLARSNGDGVRELFSKLMLNSGIGKLSEKAHYPIVHHYYDESAQMIEQSIEYPENLGFGGSGLGFLQGSYIVAAGRCYIMRRVREIAEYNRVTPADVLVYTDTDSIITPYPAPPDMVSNTEIGKLKLEMQADFSKFIEKKVYVNISTNQRKIDLHCRGISRDSIISYILDQFGEDDIFNIPLSAWDVAFSPSSVYDMDINFKVIGGRCVLSARRAITNQSTRPQKWRGGLARLGNGNIIEI